LRRTVFGAADLVRVLSHIKPDIAFFVISPSLVTEAKALFEALRGQPFSSPTIVVIDHGEPTEMLDMLKVGATDFVTAPLRPVEILPRVWRLLEESRRAREIPEDVEEKSEQEGFVGRDPAFLAEVRKIPVVARRDTGVLILGETGTGKELFAQAIHAHSPRAAKPFIAVNCGAIPVELAESELFGHERGAFTGAAMARFGMIEAAEGGTLFLDEIACLPLLAQTKLLRFLQEREFRALGSSAVRKADVRVIAATNVDLAEVTSQGRFRQDLYYRIDVVPFFLPPLRERREDIPLLAHHFRGRCATRFGKTAQDFSPAALAKLMAYDWPGNVRELEHTIERTIVLCDRPVLSCADIVLPRTKAEIGNESFKDAKARVVASFEKNRVRSLLAAHRGNISHAAQAAGKNRRAFWQLIRKHGIDVHSFRSGGFS
jgi:two-component system response regulator GlrR